MLSEKTIAIVKSTAPILEEHGETLTKHFYKRMFSHNPEVKPFFNDTHQHSGAQQRALAGAICAYAGNIDNLGALGDAVELIAQKHASLRIKAEHYPIVGENLLASIREVLGEGATDEVVNAWAEAYGFLADVFIAREAEIYAAQASAPNGWAEFAPFTVVAKQKESEVITSFYLVPANGGGVPDFKPGQYITVRVPSPCGHMVMRNYSLSDRPGLGHFRISVKRETGPAADTPKGYVSNLLHDGIEVGATLELAPPCGEFVLESPRERPLVLMAGGVGITPIMSMLQTSLAETPDRRIAMIHACLDESVQAFRGTLDALAAENANLTVHTRFSEPPRAGTERSAGDSTGLVDMALIDAVSPGRDADYYLCGPKPFMADVYNQLVAAGIPAERIRFEFFGPREALAA